MGKITVQLSDGRQPMRIVVVPGQPLRQERHVAGIGWCDETPRESGDLVDALWAAARECEQAAQDMAGNSVWTTEELLAREG